MNKKEMLIDQLKNHTFVTLLPSNIHGIGVFALKDIPKGQRGIFSNSKAEWIKIHKNEIQCLPEHSRHLVENHCLFDADHYFVPEYGFKLVDLVIYINHDDHPNLISINEGEDFEALRDILAGEELFLDYGKIV